MKKQEKNKARELTNDALEKRIEKEEKEAKKTLLKLRAGKIKNVREYKNRRKEIATLKTILHEKQLQGQMNLEKK